MHVQQSSWHSIASFEVRLDNMYVDTGVEEMYSWSERRKQPTFRSEHMQVWRAMWERLLQIPKVRVTLVRHVSAHFGCSDVEAELLSEKDWKGNMEANEQAEEGATSSEPPQQVMNDYVQKRHMIQKAQMVAVHILDWRDHNLDIAPEAKFDGDAGGGGEGAR